MKVVIAIDSLKGSLSSMEAGTAIKDGILAAKPDAEVIVKPLADGGEGTTDALIEGMNGERIDLTVTGPMHTPVDAYYGYLKDTNTAVMEMASAAGITLVPDSEKNPLLATSYGVGEMINDAIQRGCRNFIIGIGGSVTNDGGIGMLKALGVRFLDENGEELKGCGGDLIKIKKIDISGLNPLIKECRFTVMCDVTNPLCGKDGATYTFGRQKGATPEIQDELEKGMCNYRDIIQKQFGMDMDNVKGAGAAGGLGAALMVFLNGILKSGIETVLDLLDFDRRLEGVDVVVTGEGATDWQSVFGKVMQGVGIHCKAHGIPAVAIVGSMGKGAEDIFEYASHPYTWGIMQSIPPEDISNKEPLKPILGTPPDLLHPPKGCAFAARCPYAMKVCPCIDAPGFEVEGDGHKVWCWLYDERAKQMQKTVNPITGKEV